jgi:hypothetical protein
VGQKDRRALDTFFGVVGAGAIFRERNNEFYSWRATRTTEVFDVLHQLWPFLGEFKREQIRDAVARLREVRAPLKRRVREVELYIDEIERLVSHELAKRSG